VRKPVFKEVSRKVQFLRILERVFRSVDKMKKKKKTFKLLQFSYAKQSEGKSISTAIFCYRAAKLAVWSEFRYSGVDFNSNITSVSFFSQQRKLKNVPIFSLAQKKYCRVKSWWNKWIIFHLFEKKKNERYTKNLRICERHQGTRSILKSSS